MTAARTRQHPEWLRLDTAGTIYPSSRRRNWSALFRVAATLIEDVDPQILKQAAARTAARYPAYNVNIKMGVFWHYLKRSDQPPPVLPDGCCPCEPLRPKDNNGFAFRVRYYGPRIAVEFFHALTDGTGALGFLKTLLAEYIEMKYGCPVPRGGDILDCNMEADPCEYEDSFQKYAGTVAASRREKTSFRIKGRYEPDGFVNLTCGVIPAAKLLEHSRSYGVTMTQFLAGVMLLALSDVQNNYGRRAKQRHLKVSIPINLRSMFPSVTTRNFSSYVNPGIDPRYGEYTLGEAIMAIRNQMGVDATEKKLRAKFTANVKTATHPVLRIVPLFMKTPALKAAYFLAGDRKNSTTITNMGNVTLPDEIKPYIQRLELIVGPLSVNPVGCALMTYEGNLYFNVTRTIVEPLLERAFFTRLVRLGIPVKIESNFREV